MFLWTKVLGNKSQKLDLYFTEIPNTFISQRFRAHSRLKTLTAAQPYPGPKITREQPVDVVDDFFPGHRAPLLEQLLVTLAERVGNDSSRLVPFADQMFEHAGV